MGPTHRFKSANEQVSKSMRLPADGDLASTRRQLDESFAGASQVLRTAAGSVQSAELKGLLTKAADEMAAHNPPTTLVAGAKVCAGHWG